MCSPTTSPPRSVAEAHRAALALAGDAFARVDAARLEVDADPLCRAAPSFSAVPDGASTLWRWCISNISMS